MRCAPLAQRLPSSGDRPHFSGAVLAGAAKAFGRVERGHGPVVHEDVQAHRRALVGMGHGALAEAVCRRCSRASSSVKTRCKGTNSTDTGHAWLAAGVAWAVAIGAWPGLA